MSWGYVVTMKSGRKRIRSNAFRTKAQARKYANKTKKHRPGSNPRVAKAKKSDSRM